MVIRNNKGFEMASSHLEAKEKKSFGSEGEKRKQKTA
jgi:hypothetical protein